MATLQELLGGGLPPGLLSPAQQQAAEQRAQNALLTNLGFALLQSSRGQPGQRKPSIGQVIGQAGPVGLQAYQQSFDKTLADALKGIQIQDLMAKRADEERVRQAQKTFQDRIAAATTMQPTTMGAGPEQLAALTNQMLFPGETALSAEDAARTQQALLSNVNLPRRAVTDEAAANQAVMDYLRVASPVEYAKLTAKEPKESFRPLTKEEAMARGLPADKVFQISSSGKIDEIGKGPLVVFPEKGASEAMWLEVGKELPKLATQARAANQTNQALSNLVEMGEKKTFSGLLAPGQIGASQFLTSFGVKVAPETLANSRTFQAASNVLVLDFMASMGGARGFSKEESAILYDAFPKIIDDPTSRTRIANMLIQRNNRIIEDFKTNKVYV